MAKDERTAREYIERYVRYGFYRPVEIERIVGEDVLGGEVSAKRVRELVKAEVARQKAERESWPEVTDCDRLDTVFDSLTDGGIVALQNAGCTLSEGLEDVFEAYREAGGEGSGITGYCFYHRQDLEGVLQSGELCLAFGAIAARRARASGSAAASWPRSRRRGSLSSGAGRARSRSRSRASGGSGDSNGAPN